MSTITREQWGARPAKGGPGLLSPLSVKGLAFHWPAMSEPLRGVRAVSAALRGWQNFHMDGRGWSDIAYQVAVDQDGNRYELRGLRTQSGANGDEQVNRQYGAALLVLAPGEAPSLEMVRTVREIVVEHRGLFPASRLLLGHGDIRVGGTECPGPMVDAALANGTFEPVVAPPVKPKVTRGKLVDRMIRAGRTARNKNTSNPRRLARIKAALKELRGITPREIP